MILYMIMCSCAVRYGIGLLGVDGRSWIMQSDIQMAGFAEAYAASIHWALTQFTPATNNIAPGNAVERQGSWHFYEEKSRKDPENVIS